MQVAGISDREFAQFQNLIHEMTGIHLGPAKKALLCGRLSKRLRSRNLKGFGEYFDLVTSGREPVELETCVNLLTTNETYFFREAKHFDLLRERILPQRRPGGSFRVWSAACSSGEEPYTIAMVLAEALTASGPWEVFASDISTAMLEKARLGHYPLERARFMPEPILRKYCLKGVGAQAGTMLVDGALRGRVRFSQVNLNAPLPQVGMFDVIFLRNVLIYFQIDVKQRVVSRLVRQLKPGGWFIVGHSESLNGVCDGLRPVMPTVYRRDGAE